MRHIQIKTYNPKQTPAACSLFILSKGYNAGKPLPAPCPNCFVITAESDADKIVLHWTCYMLWQSGIFKRLLIGSVIQFIRLGEMKDCIEKALKASGSQQSFLQAVDALEKIEQHQQNLRAQLSSFDQLKKQLMRSVLRC